MKTISSIQLSQTLFDSILIRFSAIAIILVLSLWNTLLYGQFEIEVPQNTFNRNKISLNGDWNYFVDRYEAFYYDFVRVPFDSYEAENKRDFAALDGKPVNKSDRYEYGFDGSKSIKVPGDWNSQVKELIYYEGTIWYRKKFDLAKNASGQKQILHFGAANYQAEVYVNGVKAGTHVGGFTPFAFDITSLVKENDNSLVVRVDNKRRKEAVPTDVTDWWNYGGITRDVSLLQLPVNYIQDYQIQLDPNNPNVLSGYIKLSDSYKGQVSIISKELNLDIKIDFNNEKKIHFDKKLKKKFIRWSPEIPKLYLFEITLDEEKVIDKIGLRTITTDRNELLLNGKPIFLRGICAHEENPIKGSRNATRDDALQIFNWAKDLNVNYMRLAHYPHNEHMPQIADSLGILLWEEIPVYWTIDWKNKETYKLAENQLSEMISRDRNRASVIIWSLANETPNTKERLEFLKKLAYQARNLDNTRLLSAALFKQNLGNGKYTINDPFAAYTDVVSFNQYLGWYEGTPEILDKASFEFSMNKPVIVSEFGAGAKFGYRADSMTRWSEDYQNYLYKETLELLDRMPNLVGFSPWILADFRSPRRQFPGIQDGWNRKGLVSQQGDYKQAFYTLQKYYQAIKEKE